MKLNKKFSEMKYFICYKSCTVYKRNTIIYNTSGIEYWGGLLPLEEQYFENKESLESDIDSSINIII